MEVPKWKSKTDSNHPRSNSTINKNNNSTKNNNKISSNNKTNSNSKISSIHQISLSSHHKSSLIKDHQGTCLFMSYSLK